MRILRLNGFDVDVDQKTAIGVSFQAYDFKEPGNRKVSLTNSFTVPLTANNKNIIGYANDVQSLSTAIYDKYTADYWVDNEQLIKGSSAKIVEITQDRIKIFLYDKKTVWDELKDYKWSDFETDYLEYLRTEKGIPALTISGVTYFTGTYSEFISQYINTTENLIIPYFFSNLFNSEIGLEDDTNLYLTDDSGNSGSHVCTFVKTIFEFFEYKYDVDFGTTSTDITNIWNDTYAPAVYTPLRIFQVGKFGTDTQWIFATNTAYAPYEDLTANNDKTMYDFVRSFMQLFNIILDESEETGSLVISMRRFDDIETAAEVLQFSGKYDLSKTKFKPHIKGYEQANRIKYGSMYPGGNEFEGSKTITCNNKNLEPVKTLFSIDAYYPNVFLNADGETVLNLSLEESFETFIFLANTAQTISNINLRYTSSDNYSTKMQLSAVYGISGEYNFIEDIIAYPKYYEVERWLNLRDILNLKFFAQYYVRELNGSFFINKIKGFNPEKSNKATKIELIRVSDKVAKPIDGYDESFYIDGLGNPFVDGNNNYFT